MKTFTKQYTVYKYNELSKDVKQKVLEDLYDVNIDGDWWDSTYEDAKMVGLEIRGFDLDRGSYCEMKLQVPVMESIEAVHKNHGNKCGTFEVALRFEGEYKLLAEDDDDALCDLEHEYVEAMSREYLSLLKKDCEYLTSEESIVETIESNEWTFLENGKMFNE